MTLRRWKFFAKVIGLACLLAPGIFVSSPISPMQKKAAPRLTIYFTKGFNDVAWQKAALDRVLKSWAATAPPALGKKVVVIATIGRDGKLLDTKINLQSGSEGWDKAAVEAVKKAAPFPVAPKSWTTATFEVHFHFEYS